MTPSLKLVASILFVGSSIVSSFGSAHAQSFNGIFSPRSSERFFQDGITQLEQRIEQLQDHRQDEAEPLNIDESVDEQLQELERDGFQFTDEATDESKL